MMVDLDTVLIALANKGIYISEEEVRKAEDERLRRKWAEDERDLMGRMDG